jgi:hypothetical protein
MTAEHYTNRPDLWYQVGKGRTDFCLWDLGHEGLTIPVSRYKKFSTWNKVKHIFLIDKEAQPQMLEALQEDPRVHVWDSSVMPDEPRWHPYFWWWVATVDLCNAKNLLEDLCDPTVESPPFLFDCILGNVRKHRVWLHDRILEDTLLRKKIILNFYGKGDPYIRATKHKWEIYDGSNIHGTMINFKDQSWLPLVTVLPVNIYNQSWFSIVTESRECHTRYFSEKTAKPLLGKRLFVYFSAPGMLKDLKTLGFQTFGNVIDETYDTISDDTIRWNRAFDQVVWLSQQNPREIYQQVYPILEHNHKHFLSIDWGQKMSDEMHQLLYCDK